jgi:hypothetical protein
MLSANLKFQLTFQIPFYQVMENRKNPYILKLYTRRLLFYNRELSFKLKQQQKNQIKTPNFSETEF